MVRAKPERTREIMAMVAAGKTRRFIAGHFSISTAMVGEIIARERAKHPIDKVDEIATQVELLDELIQAASEIARLRGAPVTAGKDGFIVRDPADDTVVRDHGGRLAAMTTVRSLIERKAKLLGLDSATKTEMLGAITYTIEGMTTEEIESIG